MPVRASSLACSAAARVGSFGKAAASVGVLTVLASTTLAVLAASCTLVRTSPTLPRRNDWQSAENLIIASSFIASSATLLADAPPLPPPRLRLANPKPPVKFAKYNSLNTNDPGTTAFDGC